MRGTTPRQEPPSPGGKVGGAGPDHSTSWRVVWDAMNFLTLVQAMLVTVVPREV